MLSVLLALTLLPELNGTMTSNCGDSNRSTRLPSTLVLPAAERGDPLSLCLSLDLLPSALLTLTLLPELNGTMTSNCGDSNRSTRLPSTLVLPAAERGDPSSL